MRMPLILICIIASDILHNLYRYMNIYIYILLIILKINKHCMLNGSLYCMVYIAT